MAALGLCGTCLLRKPQQLSHVKSPLLPDGLPMAFLTCLCPSSLPCQALHSHLTCQLTGCCFSTVTSSFSHQRPQQACCTEPRPLLPPLQAPPTASDSAPLQPFPGILTSIIWWHDFRRASSESQFQYGLQWFHDYCISSHSKEKLK